MQLHGGAAPHHHHHRPQPPPTSPHDHHHHHHHRRCHNTTNSSSRHHTAGADDAARSSGGGRETTTSRSKSSGWHDFKKGVAGLHARMLGPSSSRDADNAAAATAAAAPSSSAAAAAAAVPSLASASLMSSDAMREACPTPQSGGHAAPIPHVMRGSPVGARDARALRGGFALHASPAAKALGEHRRLQDLKGGGANVAAKRLGDPLKLYRIRKTAKCRRRERELRWYYDWECRQAAEKERRAIKPTRPGDLEPHQLGRCTIPSAFDFFPYSSLPPPSFPKTARMDNAYRRKQRAVTPKITTGAANFPARFLPSREEAGQGVGGGGATAGQQQQRGSAVEASAATARSLQDILRQARERDLDLRAREEAEAATAALYEEEGCQGGVERRRPQTAR